MSGSTELPAWLDDEAAQLMCVVGVGKGGLSKSQVGVAVDGRHNRHVHPDSEVEARIRAVWEGRLKENKTLFNGTKFRLHSIAQRIESVAATDRREKVRTADSGSSPPKGAGGSGSESIAESPPIVSSDESLMALSSSFGAGTSEDIDLELRVGLTDYATFIGTNLSPDGLELQASGVREFGDKNAFMSQALGVGVALTTVDGKFLFIRRSAVVAEAAGMLDFPGGHPEPSNVLQGEFAVPDVDSLDADATLREIFGSIADEIVDEVNVPREQLSEPRMLGITANTAAFGRPAAIFQVYYHGTFEEANSCYAKGAAEKFESSELAGYDCASVCSSTAPDWWTSLAPTAKAIVKLWLLHT